MKNVFYFTSKALFVLKVFLYLVIYQNGLIEKIRLVSDFMTSQPGWQIIVMHILPNISRSKDNETMKFRQLIECSMKNILHEKSYAKYSEETCSRPFSEKLDLSISLDQ